jgi:hypothetical protein
MAHVLRSNAHRQPATAGFDPGNWWLPGLGIAAAIAIVAGGSALRSSSVIEQPSTGIAIVQVFPSVDVGRPAPEGEAVVTAPAVVAADISDAIPPVQGAPTWPAPPTAAIPQNAGIRDVDFAALPVLQALAGQLHGRIDGASVRYRDLTSDGEEEAIVSITSEGSYGNLASFVFTQTPEGVREVLTRLGGTERKGAVLTVENGLLLETLGIYGPNDANCCPGQLLKTYFRWDGARLVATHSQTLTNPTGKQAD